MGFEPGHKLATGRPPGVPNKRTQMVERISQELECDPFKVLLLFAKGDWEALGYDSSVYVKESSDGASTTIGYTISPELRAQCAQAACKYLYSTKKSVEHSQASPLEGMTPEQKLEAMKQAVKMLEGEIQNVGPIPKE